MTDQARDHKLSLFQTLNNPSNEQNYVLFVQYVVHNLTLIIILINSLKGRPSSSIEDNLEFFIIGVGIFPRFRDQGVINIPFLCPRGNKHTVS